MSSIFLNPPDRNRSLFSRDQSESLFASGGLEPGGSIFDSPSITPRNLVQPVTQSTLPSAAADDLSDTELGRAKQLLDAVRNRTTSWQDAKKWLDALKPNDKKVLIASRQGSLSEDEQRALGLKGEGGGGFFHDLNHVVHTAVDYSPIGLALRADKWALQSTHTGVGNVLGNLAGDINTMVKDTPAGIVKAGAALAGDIKTVATTNPLESSSILASLTGHEAHPSAFQQEIINPTARNYADTYGPLFRGHPGETAARIADHPLGPLLDAFAIASFGAGTAGRLGFTAAAQGAGVRNVLRATEVTAENGGARAGGAGVDRLGRVDRTYETYEPLGYNKQFYTRPTTQQIKNEPWSNHFSFYHNTKTGETLFSPVGSSHDEIFDPLVQGRGSAKASDWVDNPDVVQGTGIFDPRTGHVGAVNMDPMEFVNRGLDMDKATEGILSQAKNTYVTKKDLKLDKDLAEKGTITIKQNPGKRYDPTTGEELSPTYYVTRTGTGERIGANFPDYDSAIGYAQSLITGGVGVRQLAKEWMPFVDETGQAGRMRITTGEEVQTSKFSPLSPRSGFFTPETQVRPFRGKGRLELGTEAFTQRPRGSLIDLFESARGRSHADEWAQIAGEVINNVLENPATRNKTEVMAALKDALQQMGEDFASSGRRDYTKFQERHGMPEFLSPTASAALSAAGISIREVSDLIRAGAVFLRPAYIPNNWAGNAFLNVIHQGVYAPINLGKSLFIDKHLGVQYMRAIDQGMGFNAASIMAAERGTGYVAAATDPIAKLMGKIADQPFRRAAWIHEARRAGYKTLGDIKRLLDQMSNESARFGGDLAEGESAAARLAQMPATEQFGKISRAAQEEIIKFGKYNDIERGVLKNLIFVYSWMRGAARYFGRFPMQHPIQAAAYMNAANIGQNWLNQELGGVPNFLIGAIPVGKDDQGNSILINPFSVNPLGSGQQMLSAATSLKTIITNPDEFNKYVQTDPVGLLNPAVSNLVESYTGGRPFLESTADSIAALRLKENLQHPGRGQIYPTTKEEALGQYFVGTMFPRKSSEAGIKRSLQRERADQPEQRVDDELKLVRDTMGVDLPPDFVNLYRQDLQKLEQQKDFQHEYAHKHGSQGFTNMPPANRAEAALDYLSKYHLIDPETMQSFREMIDTTEDDLVMNQIANALWRITGAGGVKDRWDEILSRARGLSDLTPARP
jgi:hypothetical protein